MNEEPAFEADLREQLGPAPSATDIAVVVPFQENSTNDRLSRVENRQSSQPLTAPN
jgi:hypothetical protein